VAPVGSSGGSSTGVVRGLRWWIGIILVDGFEPIVDQFGIWWRQLDHRIGV
jgi:hypothetical protein